MAKKSSTSSVGGDMGDDGERDRRLTHGPFSVEVRNTYPDSEGALISGKCKFSYKSISEESVDGEYVRDLGHAAVPSGSVLVFQPDEDRCVSEFRVDLVIKKGGGTQKTTFIKRVDRPGRCWSFAAYNCGPKRQT